MSSSIHFTAITGVLDDNPLCYLLQIDDVNVLLDCGASADFSSNCLPALLKHTSQIDAILLSHADMAHIGSLPLLYKQLDLACPIFATLPVQTLGQVALQDALSSLKHIKDYNVIDMNDIENVCDKMTPLRYSQPFQIPGKCFGITITAFSAGHTVGGSIWKIRKDTDDIIYAVDYNQKKERHLNGTLLHLGLEQLTRPSLLITDAYNALQVQPNRKDRDIALIENIMSSLHAKGNVIIPVDCSTRILELSCLLDQHWTYHNITFPLVFLSPHGQKTMNVAKTMLEWFSDAIAQAFSQKREIPFELKNFKIFTNYQDFLDAGFVIPQVVLVSTAGMSTGFSYHLLHSWASIPNNLIILPDRGENGSMSQYLFEYWSTLIPDTPESVVKPPIQMQHDLITVYNHKVPLEGEDLNQYLLQKQAEDAVKLAEEEALKKQSEGIESDDEDDIVELELETLQHNQFDFNIKNTSLHSNFFKTSNMFKMFPVRDYRTKYDDYGEVIDPSIFIQGEYHNALAQAVEDLKPVTTSVEVIQEKQESPFKYAEKSVTLEFRCRLVYIDFEGRADRKSIRNIIPQVAPRKLIIVHGSEDSTMDLFNYCEENENITSDVYAPKVGEVVNVSTAKNMFNCRLSDDLLASLKFFTKGEYGIAYLHGSFEVEKRTKADDTMTDDSENIISLEQPRQRKRHRPIIIGDMKLSEFRKILQSNGFISEFVLGDLLLAELGIIIKKSASGRILLEGKVSPEYYKIRELIYAQHVLLN